MRRDMERLTDCAQGYCEMYCKKYTFCFEDPENCAFKNEIKLYDALKSIEGIVPFDRLLELADADRSGRLVVLPCALETDIFRVGKKTIFGDWQVAYAEVYPDAIIMIDDSDNHFEADDIGKTVFLTREEAEAALAGKGGDV